MSPIDRKGPEQRLELQTKDGRTAKVRVPDKLLDQLGPTHAETRMRSRPEEPPDPRSSLSRDVPPYGAG